MTNGISVIIPSYNPKKAWLEILYRSLLLQTHKNFEAIIVDDGSTACTSSNNREELYIMFTDPRFRIIFQDQNKGPAACRNEGVRQAMHNRIFFTDTDCILHPETLHRAQEGLHSRVAVMGNTITRARSYFGRAVALMGFPGGGLLGFDKVWKVDSDGYTASLSSCNVGFLKTDFESVGGFDESFRFPGGEDTVLARRMINAGYKIKYQREQTVFHAEKTGFKDFFLWQITRGRGNYQIHRRVSEVDSYIRLRFWSLKNSLAAGGFFYAPLLLSLWSLALAGQTLGYHIESRRNAVEEN